MFVRVPFTLAASRNAARGANAVTMATLRKIEACLNEEGDANISQSSRWARGRTFHVEGEGSLYGYHATVGLCCQFSHRWVPSRSDTVHNVIAHACSASVVPMKPLATPVSGTVPSARSRHTGVETLQARTVYMWGHRLAA